MDDNTNSKGTGPQSGMWKCPIRGTQMAAICPYFHLGDKNQPAVFCTSKVIPGHGYICDLIQEVIAPKVQYVVIWEVVHWRDESDSEGTCFVETKRELNVHTFDHYPDEEERGDLDENYMSSQDECLKCKLIYTGQVDAIHLPKIQTQPDGDPHTQQTQARHQAEKKAELKALGLLG